LISVDPTVNPREVRSRMHDGAATKRKSTQQTQQVIDVTAPATMARAEIAAPIVETPKRERKLVRVSFICERDNVTRRFVYRAHQNGLVPGYRLTNGTGRRAMLMIDLNDWDDYLARCRVGGSAA
jgi:hypothetical protein